MSRESKSVKRGGGELGKGRNGEGEKRKDGETERRRDGETEGWRDEGNKFSSPPVNNC